MEEEEVVWENIGRMEFDKLPDSQMIALEKIRWYKGILPEIENLKKGTEERIFSDKEKEDRLWNMIEEKYSSRTTKFKHEDGEIYPKDIEEPEIRFIQYGEPHILITDWYDKHKEWYDMRGLIIQFAEEAYLSYQRGLFLASISSAINCCEYILKYEYLRQRNKVDKKEAEKKSRDTCFSLGTFVGKGNEYLGKLNLKEFEDKIEYLNYVRVAIYHFSPDKREKVKTRGNCKIEREAELEDPLVLPIISFRVYSVMTELINVFYGKGRVLGYIEEGVSDWMNKRGLNEEGLLKELEKR